MASFHPTVITKKGHALMSKIVSGTATPNFTRIQTSDNDYSEYTSEQLELVTDIVSMKQSIPVSNISKVNEATVKVSGVLTNTKLQEGYYFRTIGLYATDPQEGEILYSITVGDQPDWVPPSNGANLSCINIDLITVVSSASNIILEVDPNAVATVKQLKEIPQKSFYTDLEVYYGNTKLIDDFQDTNEWQSRVGSQVSDFSNVKIGNQSIKLIETDNMKSDLFSIRTGLSLDLESFNNGQKSSESDYIRLVFFISDVTKFTRIRVLLGNNVKSENDYFDANVSNDLVTGWNFISIKKSDFIFTGSPNWSNITEIFISALSEDNAQNAFVSFQLIQLVKKSPYGDYPSPFGDDFIINNGEWFVGKEFNQVVCKTLDPVLSNNSLMTTKKYKNFDKAYHSMKLLSMSEGNGLCWFVDSTHFLSCLMSGGSLYISVSNGSSVSHIFNKKIGVIIGDKIDILLKKNGDDFTVKALKNGVPYVQQNFTVPFGELEGSLSVYTRTFQCYLLATSISEISHAHHSDISEIAKNLVEQPYCKIYNTQTQSIPSGVMIPLIFNNSEGDNRNHFDVNKNPYSIQIRESGRYLIKGKVLLMAPTTGIIAGYLTIDDTAIMEDEENALTTNTSLQLCDEAFIQKDSKVGLKFYQTSGSAKDTFPGKSFVSLSITRIG